MSSSDEDLLEEDVENRPTTSHSQQSFTSSNNSRITPLRSIEYGDDCLKGLLMESKFYRGTLRVYIYIFAPFERAVKKMEQERKPTINAVLPVLADLELGLLKIVMSCGTEAFCVSSLAHAALFALQRKLDKSFNLDLINAAAYLDPSMLSLVESINQKVPRWNINNCRQAIVKFHGLFRSEQTHAVSSAGMSFGFSEFASKPRVSNLEREMQVYELVPMGEDFDVLEFWRKESALPTLKHLARKILSVCASSASSERVFSKLRRLRSDFSRAQLGERTISSIIKCGSLGKLEVFEQPE